MNDLQKYLIATVAIFFWMGAIMVLSQLIPLWIAGALPL